MCGIAGILHPDDRPVDRAALEAMTRCLAHRGPDDEAFFLAPGVGLGHRRLEVIDLAGSKQPMRSESGHVLVYNGEVYNFAELREELETAGVRFHTRGDTEVVLQALVHWGDAALARFNGMFALALWDPRARTLLLARDRMGKKPLHYARLPDGTFLFGSELRSLRSHPSFPRALDFAAVHAFLVHELVPAPSTVFAAARKVLPAERLVVRAGSAAPEASRYWQLSFPDRRERGEPAELARRIRDATARRLVSDVPLGVLLSGGVDSSTVAAYAARAAGRIRTFSIGFSEPTFDESAHARRVAAFLGTEHHEELLDPAAVQALVPDLADVLDEPFADHSILPTLLLCRFTRRHVTVALGGDGGDELFAGYPTFVAEQVARALPPVPHLFARGLHRLADALLPVSYENVPREFQVKRFLAGLPHDLALRHQIWLGAAPPDEALALLAPEHRAAAARSDPMGPIRAHLEASNARHPLDRLLVQYARVYLGDGILTKTDRASMSCSLEVRAPLLDPAIVEYALTVRPSDRLKGLGPGKVLLRDAVRSDLPAGIADRPKKGFGVPLGAWLRGPLRPLMEDVLSTARLRDTGLVDPLPVRRLVDEHVGGRRDNRKILFTLMVLHQWHARWA